MRGNRSAPQIQLDTLRSDIGVRGVCVFRCCEAAEGKQRGSADFQLAAEYEPAELHGDLGRVAVGQYH